VDFELSDEQAMLREATRAMLRDRAPVDRSRVDVGADPFDAEVWRLGGELGWTGLAVDEELGGTGQGLVELVLVAEEWGRAAVSGPFLPTAVVAYAVSHGGTPALRAEVLPLLAEGGVAATWALAEPGRTTGPRDVATTARREGADLVLDGVKAAVQDAEHCRWLLVTALPAGEPVSVLVDRETPGVELRRSTVLDVTRSFSDVHLTGVRVPADRALDGAAESLDRLYDAAAVLTAADALGAMEHMLELTVAHASTRVQFGRPIGSFQAVKQACATMAMEVHATRAATHYAAMAIDAEAPDAARAAAAAASYASGAARRVAGSALQTHGGIGFTWEHDLHLYLRRATVDAVLFGDAAVHDERLCALLV
jgi:alkylation response protein AidB-like acyl-CoA dehydrogenase